MSILLIENSSTRSIDLLPVATEVFCEVESVQKCSNLDLLERLDKKKHSLIFLNFDQFSSSCFDLVKTIRIKSPVTRIILFIESITDLEIFTSFRLGAYGVIIKSESKNNFKELLTRLKNGEPPISPSILEKVLKHFEIKDEYPKLTKREIETLQLLARGSTVKEIANELKISPLTVPGYVKNIYQKLNVTNKTSATIEAINLGYIS